MHQQKDLDSIIKNWNTHYIGLSLNQETISLLGYDSNYDWEGEYGSVYTLENEILHVSIKIHAISNADIEFYENFYVCIDNTKIIFSYIHQLQNYLDQFNFKRIIIGRILARCLNGPGLN